MKAIRIVSIFITTYINIQANIEYAKLYFLRGINFRVSTANVHGAGFYFALLKKKTIFQISRLFFSHPEREALHSVMPVNSRLQKMSLSRYILV